MSNNLDLQGNVDISVTDATRNLSNLSTRIDEVTASTKGLNSVTADQARALASAASAYKNQTASLVNLARAQTEAAKAASVNSATQIREQQAVAKAAEDSARRQTSAAKTAAAQSSLGLNTSTPLKTTAIKPALSPDISTYQGYIAKVVAEDQKAVNSRVAAFQAGYAKQFAAATATDAKIAAADEAAATRSVQAQIAADERATAAKERAAQQQAAIYNRYMEQQYAADQRASEVTNNSGQYNQLRYQLYDIATAAGVMGAAFITAGSTVLKTAADYEYAFAQVQRTTVTTGAEFQSLTDGIIALSQTTPVKTTDIANIESLGAQLGIANSSLGQFAETTAKYAAVSGVSNEQVAQSFGAIFELTNTGSGDFNKLASAINYVGVKSVATDAEILSMTQSISASTTQAGFAADQTVGLASALASLRIAPEQARGVILRLFSDFDDAVSSGGSSLDAFSQQLGLTTTATAKLWKTDPEEFLNKLLKTLSAAGDLNGALGNLGISETREKNVLQRLAGNYDVYADSIKNASESYKNGDFLDSSYATVADTLTKKLQLLANNFQNLAAEAGGALLPIAKGMADFASAVLKALSVVPAPIYGVIAGFVLFGGALLALVAAGAAGIGTLLAVGAAFRALSAQTGAAGNPVRGLSLLMKDLAASMGVASIAARVNTASLSNLTGSARTAEIQTRARNVASLAAAEADGVATVASRGLGAAMLGIPFVNIIAGLSILVPLVFTLVSGFNQSKNAANEAADALISAGGGLDAFSAAVAKDTTNADGNYKGLTTLKVGLTDSEKAARSNADALNARTTVINNALGSEVTQSGAVDDLSKKIKSQTLVLGNNAKAFVANSLAKEALNNKDSDIYKFFNDPSELAAAKKYGIDLQKAVADGLGTPGGVTKALNDQIAAAQVKAGSLVVGGAKNTAGLNELQNLRKTVIGVGEAVDATTGKLSIQKSVQDALGVSAKNNADTNGELADSADKVGASFQAGLDAQSQYTNSLATLDQALQASGDNFSELSATGVANLQSLQQVLNDSVAAGSQLGVAPAQSMAAAVASVTDSTTDISSVLHTLDSQNHTLFVGMNIDTVIAQAQAIQQILASTGVTTGAAQTKSLGKGVLSAQQSKLSQLTSQRDALASQVKSQQQSASNSGNSGQKAAPKAKKATPAPEIKTASEYAQDLGTAMQEAFSKKFGVQQSMDDITSKFQAMSDRIKDAREQVASLTADLQKLASDRNILTIQLNVANNYGDTTRAQAISAALAQNATDTTSKQNDLADAVANTSTELEGNSKAAIANRSAVLDLLGAYQQQIEAYAATGASTAEVTAYTQQLQSQFVAQLSQLGYNSKSVQFYAGTFDTLTKAVQAVPTTKTVTVTADTSQATGGLNAVGNRISSLSGQLSDLNNQIAATQASIDKQKRANALQSQISDVQRQIKSSLGTSDSISPTTLNRINQLSAQYNNLQAKLASGNYYSGGVIGGSNRNPANKQDDTVINAKIGEGVVTIPGMNFLGANGLNAINNQQNPFPPVVINNNSQNPANTGTVVVELSPIDRALIAQGQQVTVQIGRDQIANAANAANLNTANRGANG